jgi:hypothetical protein
MVTSRSEGEVKEGLPKASPQTAATLLLARPKIKLFYSVKWCEFSKSAPLIVRIMHATNKIVHFITYVSFAGWQLLPFVSLPYLLIRRPHLHIAHASVGGKGM